MSNFSTFFFHNHIYTNVWKKYSHFSSTFENLAHFLFFIDFIEVTLASNIIWVSGAQVTAPYYLPSHTPLHPLPSASPGSSHTAVRVREFSFLFFFLFCLVLFYFKNIILYAYLVPWPLVGECIFFVNKSKYILFKTDNQLSRKFRD